MKDKRDWMIEASAQQPDLEFCGECHDECTGKLEDFGIGPGEAWGAKFCDVQMRYVSTCCEAEVYKAGKLYDGPSEEDIEAERGDYLYELERDRRLMERWEEEEGKS